jgi:hypothetical protein
MSHEAREMRNDIRQSGLYHSTQRREFIMWPVSYTGIKIIQDQKIEEALEHYRFSARQETQKRELLQTFGAFLARFTNFSARKPKATFPGCDGEVEGTVS